MNTSLGSGQALKPYIVQINKLSSETAVANLIPTILSDANVYVFGELFQVENIQALAKGEQKKFYDLLNIFAYGRYSDYASNAENLPKLSARQLSKLRQLTVVSLAIENRVIHYGKYTFELISIPQTSCSPNLLSLPQEKLKN
jgi:COP9 signalosome complex subunit 7